MILKIIILIWFCCWFVEGMRVFRASTRTPSGRWIWTRGRRKWPMFPDRTRFRSNQPPKLTTNPLPKSWASTTDSACRRWSRRTTGCRNCPGSWIAAASTKITRTAFNLAESGKLTFDWWIWLHFYYYHTYNVAIEGYGLYRDDGRCKLSGL